MSVPDRLGELRTRILPHLIRRLADGKDGATQSLPTLQFQAAQRYDALLTTARLWHREHQDEDPEQHQAHLLQIFVDASIPALEALPSIEEFVLNEQPAE